MEHWEPIALHHTIETSLAIERAGVHGLVSHAVAGYAVGRRPRWHALIRPSNALA
jgi:hypothetical protein